MGLAAIVSASWEPSAALIAFFRAETAHQNTSARGTRHSVLSRGLATVEPGVVCVHPQAWYEYIPIGARLCLPCVGLAWRLQHRPGQPGFGDDLQEALLHALLASRSQGRACFYCRLTDKYWFADQARVLSQEMELKLYATHGTAEALSGHRVHRARQAPRGRGDDGWMPSSRDSSTW
jgi:hypothetical protein